jgi:hypothetical protein
MLNAGNELRAEDAGCTLLARVSNACFPYLGTVLATVVNLRRRYLPSVVGGRDTLLQARDPDSGLILRPVGQT